MVDLMKGNLRQRVKAGEVHPTEALEALLEADGNVRITRPELVHWLQNAGQVRYEEARTARAVKKEKEKRQAESEAKKGAKKDKGKAKGKAKDKGKKKDKDKKKRKRK